MFGLVYASFVTIFYALVVENAAIADATFVVDLAVTAFAPVMSVVDLDETTFAINISTKRGE